MQRNARVRESGRADWRTTRNDMATAFLIWSVAALCAGGCGSPQSGQAGAVYSVAAAAMSVEDQAAGHSSSESASPAPTENEIIAPEAPAGADAPLAAHNPVPAAPNPGQNVQAGKQTEAKREDGPGTGLRPIPPISPTRQGSGATPAPATGGSGLSEGVADGGAKVEVDRVLDDFEGRLAWQPIAWENSNDCDISIVRVDGAQALSLVCRPGAKDKSGAMLQFASGADFSPFKALVLDVKVEGKDAVEVALAFQTSAYFESVRQKVAPGWNRDVTFPLVTSDYKTSPDWKHNSLLKGVSAVRDVFLVVYCQTERQVLVDNVRLVREPKAAPAAAPADKPPGEAAAPAAK